ncbi:MAG: ABC transporter substrate-binding protein [Clostridiales bacterium]|jgi:iron complex transport system substrate-binding protein|nr:ABC transporter substrate-binding protein [Clostridiales bacterium]
MKKIFNSIILIIILFSSCKSYTNSQNTSDYTQKNYIEFTDNLGNQIKVSDSEHIIVATSSFADVWQLAGGTVYATTSDAFENLYLPDNVNNIGSLHSPNAELIISLNPSLVVLSSDVSGHLELYNQLNAAGITVAYLSIQIFDDYLNILDIFTDITGRKDLYESNGLIIQNEINTIIEKAKDKPSPKILLLRVGAGKVTARNADNSAGAMLKDLGCINITDNQKNLLDELSMEAIIKEDPDYIFAVNMGNSDSDNEKTLENALFSNPAWTELSAVKNENYIILPKDLFHLKPNNRWNEAYIFLWEILYEN